MLNSSNNVSIPLYIKTTGMTYCRTGAENVNRLLGVDKIKSIVLGGKISSNSDLFFRYIADITAGGKLIQ